MESVTKAVFSNKLNSVTDSLTKNLNLSGDEQKDDGNNLSSKEARKLEEEERIARTKREEIHAKRSEEREKKRDAIRAKYGIEKNEKNEQRRRPSQKTEPETSDTNKEENKSCSIM